MKRYVFLFALSIGCTFNSTGQDLLGLSTGNYAGVTGMNLNPASIVDSRLKFDLNLIGVSNYYSNNYLSVKRDALIKGSFFKDKYKDWSLVRKDLLHENKLAANERVNLRLNNRVIAPMSFMLTTGKKSAIALNISNRTGLTVSNLNQDFARLAYRRFDDASFYGKTMDMSGIDMNVLNWLDVGFTYGRVLLDQDEHFIKAAFTAKYIGGVASGYFQSDDLSVRFSDKNTIDAKTSLARYGHGEKLSLDMFKAASLKSLRSEAEGFGWNAGIVYEYRGNIDRFKYLNPESDEKLRRDKNKYTFKVGFSIMDAGKLTFKKSDLNNDFSADITNWNLKDYKIRSITDIDSMLYKEGVMYAANGVDEYTVSLPTAYSAQIDLHLGKGFYVNAMTYQPFSLFDTDKKMNVEAAYAVTPRFESRVFGFYFPVSYNEFDDWNVGATVRVGPVYFGSANLGSLVFNDKTRTADIHAGLRIPITYGSPTRLAKTFSAATRAKDKDVYNPATDKTNVLLAGNIGRNEVQIDSTIIKKELEVKALEARLFALEKQRVLDSIRLANPQSQQTSPVSITINNYTGAGNPSVRIDTIRSVMQIQPAKNMNTEVDGVDVKELNKKKQAQMDTLVKRLAVREYQLKELKKKMEAEDSITIEEAKPEAKVSNKKKSFFNFLKKKEEEPEVAREEANNFYLNGAAETQPLTRSSKNDDFDRKYAKDLEDEIKDLRKSILAYQAISAVGVAGTNAIVSKRQAKNLEEEMERMRTDMAKYNEVGIATNSDSNYVLEQEIQRLKAELAAQQPTSIDSIGGISALEAEIAQLRQDLDTYQNDKAQDVPTRFIAETKISNNSVVDNLLSMQLEKIFFNVNEATVQPVYYKTLQFVAKSLNSHPSLGLQIDGYTDKTGAIVTNQRLSLLRAHAVKNYLLRQNVNTDQLYINSFGEKMPIANNSTISGQILNRRVEMKFVQPALAQN